MFASKRSDSVITAPSASRRPWTRLAFVALSLCVGVGQLTRTQLAEAQTMVQHPYVGMWVTDDGRIRHELLPNGRYDEARGAKASAYQGRYTIVGDHIDYVDDTGFTADGDFIDGVLHHAGMIMRRMPAEKRS